MCVQDELNEVLRAHYWLRVVSFFFLFLQTYRKYTAKNLHSLATSKLMCIIATTYKHNVTEHHRCTNSHAMSCHVMSRHVMSTAALYSIHCITFYSRYLSHVNGCGLSSVLIN